MRFVVALLVLVGALKSVELHAQQVNTTPATVVFDPLFWKDDLHLTASQYNEIQNINKEYYEGIFEAVNQNSGNANALRQATTELLQKRSEKIWGTFMPKQKRRWMKLSSEYANGHQNRAYSFIPRDSAKSRG